MSLTILAQRLRELRTQHHLSQNQIGEHLHLSKQAYCFYENGKRTPDIYTLQHLAELYNMTLSKLLEGTVPTSKNLAQAHSLEEKPISNTVAPVIKPSLKGLTSQEQKILNLFEQLTENDQDDFMDLLTVKYQRAVRNKKPEKKD